MFSRMFFSTSGRGLRVAACAMAMLAVTAAAQDNDDDGVLPKQGKPGQDASVPTVVGVSVPALGVDALDAAEARLDITGLVGPPVLDMSVAPAEAMFVATGPVDYEFTDSLVSLQGDGLLDLPPGFAVQMHAAPVAAGRATLLVVYPADVSLGAILGGAAAPTAIVPAGDVPLIDLGTVQAVVSHHAGMLSGFAVSVVFVSVDTQGTPHLSAARFATDGAPIEVVID